MSEEIQPDPITFNFILLYRHVIESNELSFDQKVGYITAKEMNGTPHVEERLVGEIKRVGAWLFQYQSNKLKKAAHRVEVREASSKTKAARAPATPVDSIQLRCDLRAKIERVQREMAENSNPHAVTNLIKYGEQLAKLDN